MYSFGVRGRGENFFTGLITVISPGPGRLVFLGEEMFPLCEGFIITVTQTHEPCHLKRLLSFICGMNTYTFWMRTLIQLLKIRQDNHWSFFELYIAMILWLKITRAWHGHSLNFIPCRGILISLWPCLGFEQVSEREGGTQWSQP